MLFSINVINVLNRYKFSFKNLNSYKFLHVRKRLVLTPKTISNFSKFFFF